MAANAVLDFQKFEILTVDTLGAHVTCASSCQISSKSVKRLQRYGDLTVFKMTAVRYLGFVKFKFFLSIGADKKPVLRKRTRFQKDRSNGCRDIAIFVIFKMAAAAILFFFKLEILTVCPM